MTFTARTPTLNEEIYYSIKLCFILNWAYCLMHWIYILYIPGGFGVRGFFFFYLVWLQFLPKGGGAEIQLETNVLKC